MLGKRPSAKSGNPKQKAARGRGVAGQSSLKAFMRPQAVPRAEQTASSALTSQDSDPVAEASLLSQDLTEGHEMQNHLESQPVSMEASEAKHRQEVSSTGMLELAQHSSQTRQHACLGSSQLAGVQKLQGSLERQSFDRASADGLAHIQSKRSCASSEADVDELVDAATKWEEVKGTLLIAPFCKALPWHALCP